MGGYGIVGEANKTVSQHFQEYFVLDNPSSNNDPNSGQYKDRLAFEKLSHPVDAFSKIPWLEFRRVTMALYCIPYVHCHPGFFAQKAILLPIGT